MTRSDCPTSMCVFSERIRCDEDCERRRRECGWICGREGFAEGTITDLFGDICEDLTSIGPLFWYQMQSSRVGKGLY